ncbi:hypothetical protein CY35_15G011500 [Sphagnum magellanicum]|jgi:hypothetical protein|nr:hypothetical protein CY35_15G011500 [Sphagnum magellanicum]
MAFGIGRGLSTPLLVINFILYLVAACLAGWALNRDIDSNVGTAYYVGNAATQWFLPIALIASVVGLASVLTGVHHVRVYRADSLPAAHAASLIAWLLTLLALGLAAKEIHIGGPRSKRLKTLEAFIIILAFFELLYLLSLHAGIMADNRAPDNTTARTGPKTGNYGTPAAAAV